MIDRIAPTNHHRRPTAACGRIGGGTAVLVRIFGWVRVYSLTAGSQNVDGIANYGHQYCSVEDFAVKTNVRTFGTHKNKIISVWHCDCITIEEKNNARLVLVRSFSECSECVC